MRFIYFTNSSWTLFHFRMGLMRALRASGTDVRAAAPPDDSTARIVASGIPTEPIPMKLASMRPWHELGVIIRLYAFYRAVRPDGVHHSCLKPAIYGTIAAKLAGVPVIVNTVTGLGFVFARNGLLQSFVCLLWKTFCRRGTWLTFQNPDDLRCFEQLGLCESKRSILIRGSGIDPDRFAPGPRVESGTVNGSRAITFLMFSRMMWSKGVSEYVAAAAEISARASAGQFACRARFVLLGGALPGNPTRVADQWLAYPDTIPSEWLAARAREGIVEFFPHDDSVIPYIHQADVVVLPCRYREGVPRSLLEAMACGKAIITTDTPGCREVVEPGRNGLLVPPRDAGALADAFGNILLRPEVVDDMGLASRRLVLERFSDEIVIRETLKVYERAGLRLSCT